jgi:HSP20 family protein
METHRHPPSIFSRNGLPSLFWRNGGGPSDIFSQLHHEVERVFDNFMGHLPSSITGSDALFNPSVDIVETPDAIDITAELPGCDAKSVDVQLVGDMLMIRGEK